MRTNGQTRPSVTEAEAASLLTDLEQNITEAKQLKEQYRNEIMNFAYVCGYIRAMKQVYKYVKAKTKTTEGKKVT